MSDTPVVNTVQEMYATYSEGTCAAFRGDILRAQQYYANFIDFVRQVAPTAADAKASLLDIGCGCGWSSFAFAENHYKTTGVDLNASAFEPPPFMDLTFLEASMLSLPFEDRSFDVVVAYQCLEHVPSPETGLLEMLRVCRKGGIVCIVGPNCLSPFVPLKSFVRTLIRRDILWKRTSTTPRHPYGNTLGEHLVSIGVTTFRLVSKLLARATTFTMRVPDTIPPFHGDNDACYLCNPTGLVKFFSTHGCCLIQVGRHGRLPLSYLLASGTWVAAKKAA